MLTASRKQFLQDYGKIRAAEGRASSDSEYYRALPFADLTGRNPNVGFHAISLECRIKINRSCKPANPAFTMSTSCENKRRTNALFVFEADCFRRSLLLWTCFR